MDYNIGIDIIELERIKNSYNKYKDRFIDKILTDKEKQIIPKSKKRMYEFIAGRWAAKESIKKVLIKELSWKDVEILKGDNDEPIVEKPDKNIKVSISHIKELVIAVAILIKQ